MVEAEAKIEPIQQLNSFFSSKGYKPHQIAGIIGNLTQESNFNPAAVGDGGMSFGIAQWNRDRLDGLRNFAQQQGGAPEDLLTQAAYIDHELNTTEAKAGEALRAAQDIPSAAAAFLGYERPQGYDPADPSKAHGWDNRLGAAIKFGEGVQYADAGNVMTDATIVSTPQVDPEVQWYLEGEAAGILNDEEKTWLDEGRKAGFIPAPAKTQGGAYTVKGDAPESGGVFDRIVGDSYKERVAQAIDSQKYDDTMAEEAFQGLGRGAGLVADVAGNVLSEVTPQFVKDAGSRGIAYLADTRAGRAVGSALGDVASSYKDFESANPRAGRNLAALGNIVNYGAGFTPIKGTSAADAFASAANKTARVATSPARGFADAIIPKAAEELIPLAKRAQEFGIPLRLDQVSPTRARNTLQKVSQEIPFSGAKGFEDTQRRAWNNQLARRTMGIDNFAPDNVNKFLSDASVKFESAIGKEPLNISADDLGKLNAIASEAENNLTGDIAAIVKRNVSRLTGDIDEASDMVFGADVPMRIISNRTIEPSKLASFRSDLIKRIPKVQGEAKVYLGDLVSTIDEIVEPSLTGKQQKLLSQARKEWKSYKTIEPLLEKSVDLEGNINPTHLMQRVAASPYIKASRSSIGEDDLIDLARIGKQFLPTKGGSDTFQKSALAGAGVGALLEPVTMLTTGGIMGLNRGLQGFNTSQRAVTKSLSRGEALKQLNNSTKRIK